MSRKKKITIVYDESSLDISSELELAFNGKMDPRIKAALEDTSATAVIEQVEAVAEALVETGHNVSTIITSSDINQLINNLRDEKPDLVQEHV